MPVDAIRDWVDYISEHPTNAVARLEHRFGKIKNSRAFVTQKNSEYDMRKAITKSLITLALAASVGAHANTITRSPLTANSMTANSTLNTTAAARVLLVGSNPGAALSQAAVITLPSTQMLGAQTGSSATNADLMQWSSLPTIILGLIGLVWVRRHIAHL